MQAPPIWAAHRPQQNRVTGFGQMESFVREGPVRVINGFAADRGGNKFKRMATMFPDSLQRCNGRRDDLRANAIPRQHCDLLVHTLPFILTSPRIESGAGSLPSRERGLFPASL